MANYPFIYNVIEIGIWAVFAAGFLLAGLRCGGGAWRRCLAAAAVFVLFAGSDAVELYTGAWWKPWWLFTWKALCVLSLFALYIDYAVSRYGLARQTPPGGQQQSDGLQ